MIAWIDISLIVNDKFIPLFFECLSIELLRKEACECITQVWILRWMFYSEDNLSTKRLFQVVNKGMPPLQKLDLIVKLKVLQLVASINTVSFASTTNAIRKCSSD